MTDFYLKYIKCKTKYLELKNNNNVNLQSGGGKKCKIDETDLVLFGDGGSTAIIIITKDKKFIKFSHCIISYQILNLTNK